ncbi:MAG TPA: hypothetical protein VEA16_04830 [Vicinamibacterales bacterium]|nr:hypothetical protein [Vicinamibacterales bacterium]
MLHGSVRVTTFEPDPLPAVPPLGPGDDDPRSPASAPPEAVGPLGPGDDDPRSPAGSAAPASTPPGPGDSVGPSVDDDVVFAAPPAPSPGSSFTGPRHVTRIPVRRAAVPPETAADKE